MRKRAVSEGQGPEMVASVAKTIKQIMPSVAKNMVIHKLSQCSKKITQSDFVWQNI